jgi:hypothetical protein
MEKKPPIGLIQIDRHNPTNPFSAQIWERNGSARTGERSAHASARAICCPPLAHLAATLRRPVFSTAGNCQSAPPLRPRPTRRQRGIEVAPGLLCRPSMPNALMTTFGGEQPAALILSVASPPPPRSPLMQPPCTPPAKPCREARVES